MKKFNWPNPLYPRILSVTIMSLFFMYAMPYGTFDPRLIGFYLSIVLAACLEISTHWLIRKFQKENGAKSEE